MTFIKELEAKVQGLNDADLAEFRNWFANFEKQRLRQQGLSAAFGLLKATRSASLEDMKAAIEGGSDGAAD